VTPASAVASMRSSLGRSVVRKLVGPAALVALTLVALLILVPAGTALAAGPPTVTAVSVSSGPTTGGTSVIITGTGFTGASAVSFGTAAAASFKEDSDTQITAVTPAHDWGTVHVTVTAAGASSSTSSADAFTFMTRYDQTDSHFGYAGTWAAFTKAQAWKGTYGRSSTSGASIAITFSGTRLDWIAMKGTTTGLADVYLDDEFVKKIDLRNPTAIYQQNVWSTGDLTDGVHSVRIVRNSASAAGTFLTIDAVDLAGSLIQAYPVTRYEQTDTHLLYTGTWSTVSAAKASGGSFKTVASKGSVKVTFTGRRLDWIATLGPGMGTADVSLDGKPAVSVPLNSGGDVYQKKVWSTDSLTNAKHTVEIAWNAGTVSVDAFDVWGTLASDPGSTSNQALWVEQRLSDLSYRPGTIDGVYDSRTRAAVIAFEKWEGMTRDGVVSTAVINRLQTASRPRPSRSGASNPWIEVNKSKQVLLYCKNGAVVWTLPVSTGSASVGIVTPSGTFRVLRKTYETSPRYHPLYITTGLLAIHGYPTVPTYPASHGCIRTMYWDQDAIYSLIAVGTYVYIYY
jgi:N-acetylmuramoyl-L-alanine amidase